MSFQGLALKIQERVVVAALMTILQLISVEISSFQLVNALLLPLCNMLLWLKGAGLLFCLVGAVSSLGRKGLCFVGRGVSVTFPWPWSYCAACIYSIRTIMVGLNS